MEIQMEKVVKVEHMMTILVVEEVVDIMEEGHQEIKLMKKIITGKQLDMAEVLTIIPVM